MSRRQRRLCLLASLWAGLLGGFWLGKWASRSIYDVAFWNGRQEGWDRAVCFYRDGGRILDDGTCYVPPSRWR